MSKNNPYDSLVYFIQRHHIDPKEEQRLRQIIKDINSLENEKEREYWEQRCEAAEAAYQAAKEWWEKELSLEGFEALSKTYDRWQQLKLLTNDLK